MLQWYVYHWRRFHFSERSRPFMTRQIIRGGSMLACSIMQLALYWKWYYCFSYPSLKIEKLSNTSFFCGYLVANAFYFLFTFIEIWKYFTSREFSQRHLCSRYENARLLADSYFSLQSYYTRNLSTRAAKPRAVRNEDVSPRRKNKRLLTFLFCLGTTKLSR